MTQDNDSMGPASEIGEQDAAKLAEVLGRLAAVTVEGSIARAALIRRLEDVLRLFEARKDETLEGLVRVLRFHLATLGANVTAAALFGSAARGELEPDSDIDLLLIADGLSQLEAQAHLKAAGRELQRAVNVLVSRRPIGSPRQASMTVWHRASAAIPSFCLRAQCRKPAKPTTVHPKRRLRCPARPCG